jgi:hypothetical protein
MRKIYKLFILLFVFSACNIFSFGSKQITAVDVPEEPVIPQPTRAELVMKALFDAFPDKIDKYEFYNDDWAILMKDGTWYYYADGRILPESQLENKAEYRSYQFYRYSPELQAWAERTPRDTERFNNFSSNRNQTPLKRSNFFLDNLWQASTRAETERSIVNVNFLGQTTKIHRGIQQKLAEVEGLIQAAAKIDSSIQPWITSLGPIEGYAWRNIAITQTRSFHAYGLAIDLLPKQLGGKQTYWLWTSQHRSDWYNVPYTERYHPPDAVIKAFEANGFVWGGKWMMFDTMHFEYRPEVLFLSGMLPIEQ